MSPSPISTSLLLQRGSRAISKAVLLGDLDVYQHAGPSALHRQTPDLTQPSAPHRGAGARFRDKVGEKSGLGVHNKNDNKRQDAASTYFLRSFS